MRLEFAAPMALVLFVILGALTVALNRFSRTYLPTSRRRLALGIRLFLLALVALALAQPRLSLPQDTVNVVFLVDASDSVGPDGEVAAEQWIRQALTQAGPRDRAGVVVFGANALVETALTHTTQLPDLASAPVRSHTDLSGAIRLGMAMLSGNGGRRLVLLSDGNENLGSAAEEARIAAVSGVELSSVPISRPAHPSVYVDRLVAPASIRKGDRFSLTGNLQSTVNGTGALYFFTDGVLTGQQTVTLHPGANPFSFPHDPVVQGFHTFAVQLVTSADATPENKNASAFAFVNGQPKVLLVQSLVGAGQDVQRALTASGVEVDTTPPEGVPTDLAQLRSYDSIVLVNVPATDLSSSVMASIQLFVRDLGGGLVTVGGDRSYASGQYTQTPLEEMLPVSSQVAPRKNLPSTAVVFIIESLENPLGVDISKESAKAAIGYLSSADQVAVNDTSGGWAVPLQNVTDKTSIDGKIDAMSPSDPSSYAPALQQAYQALQGSPAKVKHIVLMGDGDASDSYDSLLQSIGGAGITVSVVGTNVQPSDLATLQDIARAGKGRYYDGNDPFDIPQLLVKETQLVARPAIVEEAFRPAVVGASPMLRGITPASLPPLLGYVATTAKPTATVVLASNQQDPILAEWEYGLGHVVAWTSDAGGRWATSWVNWPQFSTFWSQVIRESLPSNVDQDLQTTVTATDQGAHITVDAVAPDKTYRNFLTTRATVVDPSRAQSAITLAQTSPGRYEGDMPTPAEGTYLIQITQTDASGKLVATQPTGYAVDYSPEYRDAAPNTALLSKLADLTRGRLMNNPAQAFQHDIQGATGQVALWPWLVGLGLFVLLLDVATRRLRLSRRDLALLWSRARGPTDLAANADGRLGSLRRRVLETRASVRRPQAAAAQSSLAAHGKGLVSPGSTRDVAVSHVAARLIQQRGKGASPGGIDERGARPPVAVAAPIRPRPPSAVEAATARQATAPGNGRAASSGSQGQDDERTRSRLLAAKQRSRGSRGEG